MLKHYLTVAFRNLWTYRTHNLISIIGLGVSIACFSLCMYIVRSFTGMDKEYPDSKRMYTVMDNDDKQPVFMPFVGNYMQNEYPEVEQFTCVEFYNQLLFAVQGEETEKKFMLNMLEVTPSFFDFFSVSYVDTLPHFASQENGIVLFESRARKLFGNNRACGEKMTLTQKVYDFQERREVEKSFIYSVCGVIKDFSKSAYFNIVQGSNGGRDGIFINDENGAFSSSSTKGWWSTKTIVKLHKDVSLKTFNEKFIRFSPDIKEPQYAGMMSGNKTGYYLIPFSDTLRETWGSMFYIITGIFGGIGSLVLLISLFNYLAHIISQFLDKRHGCAIRKSMNAGKIHLLFLFFTEIALSILCSILLSLCLIQALVPAINELFYEFFIIDLSVLQTQIFQYLVLGLVAACVLCLIPVHVLNKRSVKDTLFGGKSRNPKSRARNVLLGLQLFICIIFVTGSVFMYLQLRNISSRTLDTLTKTEKENIIEVDVQNSLLSPHVEDIIKKMKGNPLIEEILLLEWKLAHGGNTMTSLTYNEQRIDEAKMDVKNVGANYAGFTQTKILEGRFLKEGATDEIVINLSAKKLLGKEQVLGEVIKNYDGYLTIVGVVEDVLSSDTHSEIKATFFLPARGTGNIYLKINSQQRKKAISFIKETLNEYVPESVGYQLLTLNDRIAEISRMENILFKFIGSFAIIAIIISLFGVYSSVLLTTERRRKEVAIRKINGALLSDIIRLFLNKYLYILLIVAIPAFGVTYWILDKWLETYAYPITLSWFVFVLLFLVLAALLTLTIIYQLIKTARINPAEIIKTE